MLLYLLSLPRTLQVQEGTQNSVPFRAVCLSLQTMLGRAGGLTVLQSKGDRYSVLPGDKLKFGNVETTISYSKAYHPVSATTPICQALCKFYIATAACCVISLCHLYTCTLISTFRNLQIPSRALL